MATQAQIDGYRAAIDGLSTLAFTQVKALFQALDNPNPVAFRDALVATYPELMRPFFSAASEVAAQWYTELRVDAGVTVAYTPKTVEQPPAGQLEAQVRYALDPLFKPVELVEADPFTLLAGRAQKMIAMQGRTTIDLNAFADPVTVSWSRVARPGACNFCRMLAGRGDVYRSRAAAGLVVGRGKDESVSFNEDGTRKQGGLAKGVKPRGAEQLASEYHDHCRCVVVPTFYRISTTTKNFGRGPERFLQPLAA